jgi:hypothetical protein
MSITFRCPERLRQQLEIIAERDAVSVGATIRRLLSRAARSEQADVETRG